MAIDGGRDIDWGRTSLDYAKHRPGPPPSYFDRLQNSANHRSDKRGYNPLKVENLVDLPPETDPICRAKA